MFRSPEKNNTDIWFAMFTNFCGRCIPMVADFRPLAWCHWMQNWEQMCTIGSRSWYQLAPATNALQEWLDHTPQSWLLSTALEEYLLERRVKGMWFDTVTFNCASPLWLKHKLRRSYLMMQIHLATLKLYVASSYSFSLWQAELLELCMGARGTHWAKDLSSLSSFSNNWLFFFKMKTNNC